VDDDLKKNAILLLAL